MLPKDQRIDTKRFNEVIASGKNISAGAFYFKTLNNDKSRFAVVVSKKVTKSAIRRHLIKRRVFHAIKENKDLFPVADYIVFATKDILEMDYKQITSLLRHILTTIITKQ